LWGAVAALGVIGLSIELEAATISHGAIFSKTECAERGKMSAMAQLQIVDLGIPSDSRAFPFGRFDVFDLGQHHVGVATYAPGWRWSTHVGAPTGTALCDVAHVGLVLSGRAMVRMADGTEGVLEPRHLFAIAPGHDSWVVGVEPYVSVHFVGAEAYAALGAGGTDQARA
jgi:hypothetical protein